MQQHVSAGGGQAAPSDAEPYTGPFPPVWAVIVNWNGLMDTLECLESLAAVSYPALSVVVVDNGSRAGEADALRAKVPGVTVLETGQNRGFSGGNNVGIRHALAHGAEYVLCLNNDTTVAPDFLEPLVQALRDDPKAGMAASKIFLYDYPEQVWFLAGRCEFSPRTVARGIPSWHEHDAAQDMTAEPFEIEYATGCALLVRGALLRELDGFDERYFAYCEDVDLSLRAGKLGWARLAVPRSRVWHKVSRSSGGDSSPSVLYYCIRNSWLLARAHAPGGRAGAEAYLRTFRRKHLRDAAIILQAEPLTGRERTHAQARLSAVWSGRLGLYGPRREMSLLERLVAVQVALLALAGRGRNLLRSSAWLKRSYEGFRARRDGKPA